MHKQDGKKIYIYEVELKKGVKVFNPKNKNDVSLLRNELGYFQEGLYDDWINFELGMWKALENPIVLKAIKSLKYDAWISSEYHDSMIPTLGVFDPKNLKII